VIHKLRLIRIPNLLIIAATVVVIQQYLSSILLTQARFGLLLALVSGIALACIAAAGYIHNDIQDAQSDSMNRPEAVLIPKFVSQESAKNMTKGFLMAALAIVLPLCLHYSIYWPLVAAPIVVLILYLYNKFAQSLPLLGNLLVAFLCSAVVILPVLLEMSLSHSSWAEMNALSGFSWIGKYILFSFLLTLAREIFKDLEDMDGDRAAKQSTLPIYLGESPARIMASLIVLSCLLGLIKIITQLWTIHAPVEAFFLISFVAVPLIIAVIFGSRARSAFEYAKASMWLKHSMSMGLFFLLLLTYLPS